MKGSVDIGGFDSGSAALAGESHRVGLMAVFAGVGGIAVGLEREESVEDGDHPVVEPFGDLATWIVRCDEGNVG
jgi:hypothetical protein